MISQEKLRKYVDIIEKYDMISYATITLYNNEEEVYLYVEGRVDTKSYGSFLAYGGYNFTDIVKLYPSINTDWDGNGTLPKYALEAADVLRRCALACREINELKLSGKSYFSSSFAQELKNEYKRRGKDMKIYVDDRRR